MIIRAVLLLASSSVDFVHPRMGVGVTLTIDLVLEMIALVGRVTIFHFHLSFNLSHLSHRVLLFSMLGCA
jgi:hypothetical protein